MKQRCLGLAEFRDFLEDQQEEYLTDDQILHLIQVLHAMYCISDCGINDKYLLVNNTHEFSFFVLGMYRLLYGFHLMLLSQVLLQKSR